MQIIQTKLKRPPLRNELVQRMRLQKYLDSGVWSSLILVSAPAGYGKSILISQWLESKNEPSAWISLDTQDSQLPQFLAYFIAAVQQMFPQACLGTQTLLWVPTPPPLSMLAGCLVNELNTIEKPFILVLDDYQLVTNPEVHELLGQLLKYLPNNLHLVIISRHDPPLPLSKLRGKGQLKEVRLKELEFTALETQQFFQQLIGLTISNSALTNLQEQMEGWAGGLHLLSLVSLSHDEPDKFLQTLKGNLASIQDYLVDEALSIQPPNLREWLKQTAILDRFCSSLVEAVCQSNSLVCSSALDGETFLNKIVKGNLFIINLSDQNEWYRYHHLFRQLLLKRLKRDYSPEAIAELHRRASEWFEAQDLIEEALHHALKAEDAIRVAQIIERHRMAEMNADRWYRLENWLQKLPEAFIQKRLSLLLCRGWIQYYRYRLKEMSAIIKQVEMQHKDEALETALSAELNILKGINCFWQGQSEDSLNFFQKGFKNLPQTADFIKSETEIYLGLTLYILGQKQKAINFYYGKLQQLSLREFLSTFRLMGGLFFTYMLSGQLSQAAETARQMKNIGEKNASLYAEMWGRYGQACTYLFTNKLESALANFSFIAERRYFMDTRPVIDSLVGLALTYQGLQQQDLAREKVKELVDFAWQTKDLNMLSIAHSAEARLALLQGDLLSAIEWERSFNEELHFPTMFCWLEVPAITQARVLVAVGSEQSLQSATKLLDELWKGTEALHYTCQMIQIGVLQVLALEKQGHRKKAFAVLKLVVTLAEPGGFMSPFLELGNPMANLLRRLYPQYNKTFFVPQLLEAFQISKLKPTGSVQTLVEPLTQREAEILEMLSQRLHDKEIAQQLRISTTTVKSHLKHIYQKLNVHNRGKAAARALELGVLPLVR
ncbi:MAG: LuxR C-terminal-related transcriptional regulator [Waterburya sp.]